MTSHPRMPEWDTAPAVERRRWMGHVESCSRCRDRWLGEEPSRLFSLLEEAPVDREILDDLTDGVLEEIGGIPRKGIGSRTVAVLAASFILAVLALPFLMVTGTTGPATSPVIAENAIPPAGLYEPTAAGVEILSTPGTARVVDMTVGETKVVMIFDERLEL